MTKKCDIFYNYFNNNILDSKLIIPTMYNLKFIDMGEFSQVYYFPDYKKTPKQIDNDYKNNLRVIKSLNIKENKSISSPALSEDIDYKNIIRSKLSCQRLAKANIKHWKSFITLTYSDNINDIKLSRKHFSYFIDSIRRKYKDFRYIAITEFQKRGAIHYHLLTNINKDSNLLYIQDNKFYHIKYWNRGFTSVEFINQDYQKIIGYISKYMTKDIDNRLFNSRRYLYSRNLIKPIINYIDINNNNNNNNYNYKWLQNNLKHYFRISYQNYYTSLSYSQPIFFQELTKK